MPNCNVCNKKLQADPSIICDDCGENFCAEHIEPSFHNCKADQKASESTAPITESQETTTGDGSIGAGFLWMALLSVLLFWLPTFGPLIAGYVGGRKSGGAGNALIAAVFPAVIVAALPGMVGGVAGFPMMGAILAGGTFVLLVAMAFPLIVGALIGGAMAPTKTTTTTTTTTEPSSADAKPSTTRSDSHANGSNDYSCTSCGEAIDPESSFCKYCGTEIQSEGCPECGADVDPDAKFCSECGADLPESRDVEPENEETQVVGVNQGPRNYCKGCGNQVEPFVDVCSNCDAILEWE